MTDFRPETERTLTSFPADYPTADDIKAEIDRQWAAGDLSRISYIFWRLMSIITAGIEAAILREANKLAREMVGNAVAEAMEPVVEDYRQRTKEIRREADRRVEDAEKRAAEAAQVATQAEAERAAKARDAERERVRRVKGLAEHEIDAFFRQPSGQD